MTNHTNQCEKCEHQLSTHEISIEFGIDLHSGYHINWEMMFGFGSNRMPLKKNAVEQNERCYLFAHPNKDEKLCYGETVTMPYRFM